ncbi:MAG: hypothetical protein GX946_05140 [Oligosphaeraceae bacterium]|nr:hypothetical protein [Oligosphaeraceae bacterium]
MYQRCDLLSTQKKQHEELHVPARRQGCMSVQGKTFFLIAVACFVLAIISNFAAKQQYSAAAGHKAIMTQNGEQSNAVLTNDGLGAGKLLETGSGCFAISGIISWISAAGRKERCRHSILVILLAFFILLIFMLV